MRFSGDARIFYGTYSSQVGQKLHRGGRDADENTVSNSAPLQRRAVFHGDITCSIVVLDAS